MSVPCSATTYEIELENGGRLSGRATPDGKHALLAPISQPGYHRLTYGDQLTTLAIAPKRCFQVSDTLLGKKAWGVAVQLYSLRRPKDGGIGDFSALADLAQQVAALGAHSLAISPVHAQFTADPDRFSPYAPSSRTALNILHIPTQSEEPELEALALIDWPRAARAKLRSLPKQPMKAKALNVEQRPGPLGIANRPGSKIICFSRLCTPIFWLRNTAPGIGAIGRRVSDVQIQKKSGSLLPSMHPSSSSTHGFNFARMSACWLRRWRVVRLEWALA